MKKNKREHLINQEIRFSEVRVTDSGIMPIADALALAESKDMDLVLINDKALPPVVRILNYEKFIYELSKKPKNKSLDMKEIKLGPNTAENDLEYRAKHMTEFLQKGHKVKVTLQFRGREMAHIARGEELMLKLIVSVEEYGTPEAMPKMEGKKMLCIIKPKVKK